MAKAKESEGGAVAVMEAARAPDEIEARVALLEKKMAWLESNTVRKAAASYAHLFARRDPKEMCEKLGAEQNINLDA